MEIVRWREGAGGKGRGKGELTLKNVMERRTIEEDREGGRREGEWDRCRR